MTLRITVLTGGTTPERDVALAGAAQVVAALRGEAYEVIVVDTVYGTLSAEQESDMLTGEVKRDPPSAKGLELLRQRELGPRIAALPAVQTADVVFPVLHGRDGEGGGVQALLDLAGVAYVGSDALGSAVAMSKHVAKTLLRAAGVKTPDWMEWPVSRADVEAFGLPVVVKPSRVGSSVGLSVVDRIDDLDSAVEAARAYDEHILVERCVDGRELTVGVLGKTPLAVGEIIPQHAIFDYECKYTPGMSQEIFPADIPANVAAALQTDALTAHRCLQLRDMSRVDFILAGDDDAYCLEANTLPGFTRTSLLPQSAAAAGFDFATLCRTLCEVAAQRAGGTKEKAEGF